MDVFKFAFETVVLGLLALPWLMIVVELIAPGSLSNGFQNGGNLLASIPDTDLRRTVMSVLLFAVVYLVGSAVSPLAQNALDDDDLASLGLPGGRQIRHEVYNKHDERFWSNLGLLPHDGSYLKKNPASTQLEGPTEIFRAQETSVLLEGAEKSQRTKQLHEQIMVLQGAALSALMCGLLCIFACISVRWPRSVWAAIAPVIVLTFGGISLYHHFREGYRLHDPPLLELVLFLAGGVGLRTAFRTPQPRRFGTWALVALLLGMVAYWGWWWSQVSYYEHVIHSFAALNRVKHP
jgi:hypothetical protein